MMSHLDILVLVLYFLGVLWVGWRCRDRVGNQGEHFLAGRRMGMIPVGLSLMVTSFSALNYVAIPEEVSGHGLYVVFSFPVFFLAAYPIARWWIPYFQKLQCTTVYEFLEEKYDRQVRLLASGLFLLWRLLWMAMALYASGKVLALFSGYPPVPMILLCGGVAVIYTAMGGMRAVMWTDVLQFLVLISGIVLGLCFAWHGHGTELWGQLQQAGRLKPFVPFDSSAFSLNPSIRITLWSALWGTFAAFMTRYGADQIVMQRYFAARDARQAQKGIWLNAVVSVVSLLLLVALGLAVYGYGLRTGLLAAHGPQGRGMALKLLAKMTEEFPAGYRGLLLAGLLAATMSSVDSGMNGCAATLRTDFQAKGTPRMWTLLCGVGSTLLAVLLFQHLNQHQSLFGLINRLVNGLGTPLLALIVLARFHDFWGKWTTSRGVFCGGLFGIIFSLYSTFTLQKLALHYYAVVNFLVTFVAALFFSWGRHRWLEGHPEVANGTKRERLNESAGGNENA